MKCLSAKVSKTLKWGNFRNVFWISHVHRMYKTGAEPSHCGTQLRNVYFAFSTYRILSCTKKKQREKISVCWLLCIILVVYLLVHKWRNVSGEQLLENTMQNTCGQFKCLFDLLCWDWPIIIFAILEYNLQQILHSSKVHFISRDEEVYCWEDYDILFQNYITQTHRVYISWCLSLSHFKVLTIATKLHATPTVSRHRDCFEKRFSASSA